MTDVLARGRKLAEEYNQDGHGFPNKDRINAYVCDGGHVDVLPGLPRPGCNHFIITIDRDFGVTPFIVRCGHCSGMAYSKMYRVADLGIAPTHEWYRPETLEGIDDAYHDHLGNGGLILREIEGRGRWLHPQAIEVASWGARQ